jgi:magnesium-transporting ATPase (P-type)
MKEFALPIRFGIATSGCLIAYFLILAVFDLHTNVFYSFFNGVITGFGIYEAIKYFRSKDRAGFNYGKGFTAGIVTGFLATIIFTLFFTLYSTEINPDFLQQLITSWFKSFDDFQAIVFFTVAIMGFATSLVLTLAFMQLFKTPQNPKKKSSLQK